jgi:hypothetical protein
MSGWRLNLQKVDLISRDCQAAVNTNVTPIML